MLVLLIIVTFFSSNAADFPICDDMFASIEDTIKASSISRDKTVLQSTKNTIFKITNEKRQEVLRYVRLEKDNYRKGQTQRLKDFDVEAKKNKATTAEQRTEQRKARAAMMSQQNEEKKLFFKDLDAKDKNCQNVLAQKKEFYLQQIRELTKVQSAPSPSNLESPELDEFKLIPKGPGTVLKPE